MSGPIAAPRNREVWYLAPLTGESFPHGYYISNRSGYVRIAGPFQQERDAERALLASGFTTGTKVGCR